MSNPSNAASRTALRLEQLEAREVPAILIQVDYTYDTGFFANNPQARATLEMAAAELGNSVTADLGAIVPSGANTWTATFPDPATGAIVLTEPGIRDRPGLADRPAREQPQQRADRRDQHDDDDPSHFR